MAPFAAALMVLALGLAAAPGAAHAQADPFPADSLQELRRADGSREIGRVLSVRGDTVTFETISGERLEVRSRFAHVRPARGRIVEGEFWPEDRHTTRLFFAPTGRTLRQGAGYGGFFFFLPFVGYGATDDVTVAGGLPFVGSLESTPVWIAPKLRVVDRPRAQVSAGVFAIRTPPEDPAYCEPDCGGLDGADPDDGGWNGIVYGVGTFGDSDNALHAGAGLAFVGDEGIDFPVMVGGERRISRRNKLITENWLIPGDGAASSFGVRRLGERWTIDYGLMFLFGGDTPEIPYFPIVSFSYAFGSR